MNNSSIYTNNAPAENDVELGQMEGLLNEEQPRGLGRVKSVNYHNSRDWLLTAHYSGDVVVWDLSQRRAHRRIHVADAPLRSAKFVESQEGWIVLVSDDGDIHVVDYETQETVETWEAHEDYIRDVVVHPDLSCLISCADDMMIKVWDYEDRRFSLSCTFSGHFHYVMQVKVNPQDTNWLASASLDRRIRFWKLDSFPKGSSDAVVVSEPEFILEGHEEGVNCIAFDASPGSSLIVSGSDDNTVKIWNYKTRVLIHSFSGHTENISAVLVCRDDPRVIASASEDGIVMFWSYVEEKNRQMERAVDLEHGRAWCLDWSQSRKQLAIGYDEGCSVVEENFARENAEMSFFPADADSNTHPHYTRTRAIICQCFFIVAALNTVYALIHLWKFMIIPAFFLVLSGRDLYRCWRRRQERAARQNADALSSQSQ